MSKFLSPTLAAVTPYTPGEQPQDQQYIKLNTNESPYLPSPPKRSMPDKKAGTSMPRIVWEGLRYGRTACLRIRIRRL